MVKRSFHFFASIFIILMFFSCSQKYTEPVVMLKTRLGDIKLKLYDDTPLHRDNFLKLAKNGTIDSTLFHRVIKDFMIQGGDPNSKHAESGDALGDGGPDYTLPAEIKFPEYFHKRGALAAARESDQVNPEKRSSGSQFYIVQGEVLTENDLVKIENKMRESNRRKVFNDILLEYNDSLNFLQEKGKEQDLLQLQQRIMARVNEEYSKKPEFSFPDSIKQIYTTKGGTPFLDDNYTVFGEVMDETNLWEKIQGIFGKKFGMDVVDAIANEMTDGRNRPLKDIRMKVEILND